jgi:tetratricopeptide (TPR) repeat protein
MLGRFEEAKPLFNKGLDFALEAGSVYGLGLLELLYGLTFVCRGDGKQAVDHLERSIGHLEESQIIVVAGFALGALGYGFYLMGDLEAARNHLEKGISILKEVEIPVFLSMHFLFIAIVQLETGDNGKAQSFIKKALELCLTTGERHWEGVSRVWQGRILHKCNTSRLEKAEECILAGIAILKKLQLKPFLGQGHLFLGELYANRKQPEKALENLRKAEGMFKEMGMDYWLGKTRNILDRL